MESDTGNQSDANRMEKDLGKTWMLTNGTLLANVSSSTKTSIINEVEFAYLHYLDIVTLLKIDGSAGGMIVEKKHSTLIMGNFIEERNLLVSAEGEWIEDGETCFDYCLSRV